MVFGTDKMSTIKLYSKIYIISFILIILNLFIVNAHLEGGQDKEIDGYVVDLGWDPEFPKLNEKVAISINIANATDFDIVDPTSVWVRISSERDVVFAGTLNPKLGNAALIYTFPEEGSFDINIRIFDKEELLIDTDFFLNVKGKTDYSKIIILFLLLIILVMVLKNVLFKHKKI